MPKSRLGRLATLARAGARTGSALVFSKNARKHALKSTALLGQLRGVATKMGQMLSYVDGLVPPEHRDTFEKTMGTLQAATPASPPAEVRELIRQEFGKDVTEVFATWEDEPVASASIGQVHRATTHEGDEVAVKVHHPGIVEALEADLNNAGAMEMILSLLGSSKFGTGRLVQEIKDRFREELDYVLEAERIELFQTIHEGDPTIRIPKVYRELSSKRVLTTEFVRGMSYQQAREASEEERVAWCETLWRFVYKAILVDGYFNADPHPGNYFFHESGVVTFVDFGCVQKMPENRRNAAIRMHWGANHGDQMMFDQGCRDVVDCEGGLYEKLVLDYLRSYFRPITDSPFHLSPDYAAHVVRTFKKDYAKALRNYKDGFVPMPEGLLFINRLEFGFFSIIARLNVTVDFRKVEAAYVSQELIDQALLEMPEG